MQRIFLVFSLLVAVSCARHNQVDQPRAQTNTITRDEIEGAPVTTAYEAIDRLRPRFLRPHATGGRPPTAYAVVFVDGVRRGALEILRTIAASSIAEVRYLTAADATTRYGLDVQGGVIDVKLHGR